MKARFAAYIVMPCLLLAGCTVTRPATQDSQDLKEKTAQATAELKQDAKAMAAGIHEGWNRDKAVDLNQGTREQLLALPGFTHAKADAVIANRPYDSADQLVSRKILTAGEYDKVAGRVVVKK